jgi:bifunctional non-homologous end joining protein LigD
MKQKHSHAPQPRRCTSNFHNLIVADMSKALRAGKGFIDWSQNIQTKTTVGVYSLRAKRNEPFVSVPVEWSELKTALRNDTSKILYFTPDQALKRLDQRGDL